MAAQTRVLSLESDMAAVVRGAANKRGFASISRASYSSSSSSSSSNDQDTVDIPEVLNSRETLEFCGLNTEVSDLIFESWERLQQTQGPGQPGHGNSIATEAKHYVRRMAELEGDAWRPDHDWRRALTAMGASQRLSDAILHSNYASLRNTASASYWILDTIDLAWEFLEGLDKRIRKKQADTAGRDLVTPSPSIPPRPAMRNQSGLLGAYQEPSVFRFATMSAIPSTVEGRTVLYKGGSMTRLIKLFKDEDGSLNITQLFSSPPTDFHRLRDDLLYLSKQLDVAETYAGFAMTRLTPDEGGILHFAVPSELLEDCTEIFGPDWQQLVFWARGPKRIGGSAVPSNLAHFAAAPLLIGCVYGMPNDRVARLERPSDLTSQYMKTRAGGNASQHVFQGDEVQMQFQEKCRGWVWYQSMRYNREMGRRFLSPTGA
ncbi:hypothetical protein B0H67DRAFT_595055 [Lasiosphaeris hirsuta]|uniref:Uncharacterized protein n=1 Tax=Lasiosphaeris hirsuta TaxID=260670 RepID=A0AA39ZSD3_9PEZI|nr:hypothetical protein B0H67DRAFT_595055 [Lasiosphaeris hirsuta]